MTDPVRLLDTSSPALAAVLRSASADIPVDPEGHRRRIIGAAFAVSAALPRPFWMRRAMWLVVGSAIAVGSGAWWLAKESAEGTTTAEPRTFEASRITMASQSPAGKSTTSIGVDDLPTASPGVAAREEAPAPLPDELSMIDAVRSSLAAGHPREAIERLAAYRRVYPRGAFEVEGDVLEVQALSGVGSADAAREKARRFLATHPGSPYEKRIRAESKLNDAP